MVVPPNIEQLREARSQVGERAGNSWRGAHFLVRQEVVEAADFLLSLLDEGGRLIVETHCEHGELEEHYLCDSDMTLHDARTFTCVCPGGSRMQVWPAGREER